MADRLNILIADGDPGFASLLKEMCAFIDGVHILGIARSRDMLTAKINTAVPDLILLDPALGLGGLETVEALKKTGLDLKSLHIIRITLIRIS